MLSEKLLEILRDYWREYRPQEFLFFGQDKTRPVHRKRVWVWCQSIAKKAQLTKSITVHTLRHTFATHLLEGGTNVKVLQALLGHRCLRTTARYTHVSREHILETKSPLDRVDLNDPNKKDQIDPGNPDPNES